MSGSGPEVTTVTLHVWRVPARRVPAAMVTARLTVHRLRRRDDVRFAKVLGTSSAAFTPRAATPRRWAALICWRGEPGVVHTWFDRNADEHARLSLRTLSTRGTWDRREPFGAVPPERPVDGPVVVLTRSTVRWSRSRRFYRAIPPVAAELAGAEGCRVAFGIGEAPIHRQGTVSLWESTAEMKRFAYDSPGHRAAIDATPRQGWYAEELFTRFAVVGTTGSIDGTPL